MSENPKPEIIRAVKDYGKKLFGFIRNRVRTNEEAEDILQDVWFQLSSIIDFDSIEHLSGWLYSVARNRITDLYRKKKTDSLDNLLADDSDGVNPMRNILIADSTTPEMENLKQMFWDELLNALEEIPESQRQVFILNELEDMTLQEIADKTGEKLKTVISRKRYAVQHLRRRLEDLYNDIINY